MSDSIEVPYNTDLEALQGVLARVRRPGDFFVHGSLEAPMPCLQIGDIGQLSFPVPESQIAAVLACSELAPYGRGRETVLDTSVRKVWQLAPSNLEIGGKSWPKTLRQILSAVADGLGCADIEIAAGLYKLLIYDKGAFFKSHRDTEKADGMFGTLLIVLPSPHAGGEVAVRHAGREMTIDLSGGDVDELEFAAFYADCEHEVRPVTRGNRVCLVYNLLQPLSKGKRKTPLVAPIYDTEVVEATDLLKEAFARRNAPTKIAWLLEHQYSPAGLSFAALKNADRALARVLQDAAARAGCAVHLGIVHIEEYGAAELSSYGGWGRYDEEGAAASDDDYKVIEVSDGWSYIDQWVAREGEAIDFGRLPLRDGEVLPRGALDGEPPDENRLLEASGNEGASFERSYHRAALVVWPRGRFIDVLLQAGVSATLPYLEARVARPSAGTERSRLVSEARRVVDAWERRSGRHDDDDGVVVLDDEDEESDGFDDDVDHEVDTGDGVPDRGRMIAVLHRLGDAGLLERFVRGAVTAQFDGSETSALAEASQLLGAKQCGALLPQLVSARAAAATRGCMDLVTRIIAARAPSTEWMAALREIAGALIQALPNPDRRVARAESHSTQVTVAPRCRPDGVTLANLLAALEALEEPRLRSTAYAVVVANTGLFDTRSVVVPALERLSKGGTDFAGDAENERLWRHAADRLLAASEQPPPAPQDWRLDVRLSCTCADCRALQRFANDPAMQTYRFRVRKDRRQHLHRAIEAHGLDMTHVTERQGSPQTLVCTKTRRNYARRCEEYRRDIDALGVLAKIVDVSTSGLAPYRERITAARALAAAFEPAITARERRK